MIDTRFACSTPEVLQSLTGSEASVAESRAQSKNSLIIFEWDSSRCFIEGLPDYKERVERLQSRTEFSLATAVMVGSVGSRPYTTIQEVEEWFPTELLAPLCVASGAFVGFPYVELRGEDGGLYKRIHIGTHRHRYTPAKPHIHEIFDDQSGATGALLTSFSALPADKKRSTRIAAEHLTAVSQNRSELENTYDHLVRGFEFLTTEFGTSSENMLSNIDATHQASVTSILQTAKTSLTTLAQSVRAGGDHRSADRIDRIAARAQSASQTERSFGFAVSTLCQRYNFSDEAIINDFYGSHPRADGNNSWAGVLSAYRGGVIHVGYLELPSASALQDVLRYNAHLHDLLTRIVLIEMGYRGTYQPVVSETFESKPLDWVTLSTMPNELGFA